VFPRRREPFMSGPICSSGCMRRGPVLFVVSWASPDRVRTPFEASMVGVLGPQRTGERVAGEAAVPGTSIR
jgi:hypothetical protein